MFLPDEITEVAKLDGVHAKIVDFEPHHIDKISYRSADSTFVQANKEQLVSRLPKGMSFSGTYDDQVFAMFGLVPYWKGCYECWLIPATDLDIHKMNISLYLFLFQQTHTEN